jgi:hypothetical protein
LLYVLLSKLTGNANECVLVVSTTYLQILH